MTGGQPPLVGWAVEVSDTAPADLSYGPPSQKASRVTSDASGVPMLGWRDVPSTATIVTMTCGEWVARTPEGGAVRDTLISNGDEIFRAGPVARTATHIGVMMCGYH